MRAHSPTYSQATLGNGVIAIVAGQIAQFAADKYEKSVYIALLLGPRAHPAWPARLGVRPPLPGAACSLRITRVHNLSKCFAWF
jgi:hypothetical protein